MHAPGTFEGPPLLELRGVSKRYQQGAQQVVALDRADLAVGPGEFVSVVGPSGSGKSTLLHLAGGLDLPDEGAVHLGGRDLGAMSLTDRARLRREDVGFIFQFFHLIPTLSVGENVELPLLLARRRGRGVEVERLLDRLGIGHRARHLPGELSGGEMQRAAIARALVAQPKLLLADEPTGNLDSVTGEVILEVLGEAVERDGVALVMVTHDEHAAARAHRTVHVRDGRLVEQVAGSRPAPDPVVMAAPPLASTAGGGAARRRVPLRIR